MNNSATTRAISKIALEYNGNDKGMAIAAASNFLLSSNPEQQYQEMKTVADRNSKVKKWALTGYISPPTENTKQLSDEELTDIAIEALQKIGVTDSNQYRLDIHNSTRQKLSKCSKGYPMVTCTSTTAPSGASIRRLPSLTFPP